MRVVLGLIAVLLVAGCGGNDRAQAPAATAQAGTPTPQPPAGSVDARAQAVVRAWAADLRRGDVESATDRFAVPAIIANNTPEIRLRTRDAVRTFNAGLTCGGKVTELVPHAGVLIATFVFTERPGGDCGVGVGAVGRAAFEVRGGRIVRWLRLPDPEPAPGIAS